MLSLPQLRKSRLSTVEAFQSRLDRADSGPQPNEVNEPAPNHQQGRILSIGDDRLLLYSRRMILETAGYSVESARGDLAIEQALLCRFDLVLLCHTIGDEVVSHIMEASARIAPETCLLQISPLDSPFRTKAHPTLISADPAALLSAVARQLENHGKLLGDEIRAAG